MSVSIRAFKKELFQPSRGQVPADLRYFLTKAPKLPIATLPIRLRGCRFYAELGALLPFKIRLVPQFQ